jgi:hypothetical protein
MANPNSLTGKYLTGRARSGPGPSGAAERALTHQGGRRARQQPEERHRRDPARPVHLRHRRLRRRQVDLSSTRSTRRCARKLNNAQRARRPARPHRGAGASRQGHRHRPVADRPHAALQPGDLHRRLHADPRLVRRPAGAKARGYKPGPLLSFNVKGGRCEACQGDGVIKIEMHFLPDVYVTCDVCKGKRYNRETLEVLFKGKSIADVLDMTVEEAAGVLQGRARDPRQAGRRCSASASATSRSASRRPRSPAARRSASSSPRSCQARHRPHALHPRRADHRPAFRRRRSCSRCCTSWSTQGNTVVVIEHNLEVIKTADWIIDLGPEGGDGGGEIVAGIPFWKPYFFRSATWAGPSMSPSCPATLIPRWAQSLAPYPVSKGLVLESGCTGASARL